MKTVSAVATADKTASTLDFSEELKGLDAKERKEVLEQIGGLIVDQILQTVAESRTPVSGGQYKRTLSKAYAEKKKEETGSTEANLDLTGEMLSSLEYKIKGSKLEIGVYGEDAGKADGHNNFSGDSKLPRRQFLPDEGQVFKSDISDAIIETIKVYKADNLSLSRSDLSNVETKTELYDLLKEELGDLPRSELRDLVLGSQISAQLDEFDLLDLL